MVSIHGLRIILFLPELIRIDNWATDIYNINLEAKTSGQVYIIAGPEFSNKQGSNLVIFKALYVLRSSGLRWHENLADNLRNIRFKNFKVESDIWIRRTEGLW